MTGSHDLTISLSYSPGSVLQVGMRQMTLIAAHFAAYIHKHTIFAPGLGYVAAFRTVVQEMSHCYDTCKILVHSRNILKHESDFIQSLFQ